MYSKKEEWGMLMTLLFSFFSSNYMLRMYIENYTLFAICSILSLFVIGSSIVIFMEKRKSKQIEFN